jgi:hypothetical protein
VSDISRNNAAGRLHALLVELESQTAGQSLAQAWKNVLETTDEHEFQFLLAEVSKLVPTIKQAVATAGSRGNAAQVERYREQWSKPIFPQDRPFSHPVQEFKLPPEALDALASVAEYLQQVSPEAMPAADADLDRLRAQLDDLIQDVEMSEDLSDEARVMILDRLNDVLHALDQIDIGGPAAVRHATEALAGAIDLGTPRAFWSSPAAAKARAVVVALWMAFTAPGAAHDALPVWEQGIRGLMPVPAQVGSRIDHDQDHEREGSHSRKALPAPPRPKGD